jgi:hypothetical protein
LKASARAQLQAGWRDAQWAVYFTRALLPALALALAVSWLVEGHIAEPPGILAWALCVLATLGALYWAGLREGWEGRLGRYVWVLTLLIVGYWLILALVRTHEKERQRRVRLAGHSAAVTAVLLDDMSNNAGLPRSSIHWEPITVP